MTLKDSVLSRLMENAGEFISGEELSSTMDVSRTAVWKAINSLRKEGHAIEAVTNKGYCLKLDPHTITEGDLRSELSSRYKDIEIHIFDTLDSTNTTAKQLALAGSPHGTVVMARSQSGGRGRLGRSFHSPKDGIYLSILIRPDFGSAYAGLVTTAAAVAVCDAVETVCGLDAGIKWVNDIYVSGKKVCGILSEGMTDFETGRIESMIIGIGINTSVEGFPGELLKIAGAVEGEYSRSSLAADIICKTLGFIDDIESRHFIETYKEKSLVIGKDITVYKGIYKNDPGEVPSRPARALDIDDDGGLVVMYTDGSRETLISGEISIRV